MSYPTSGGFISSSETEVQESNSSTLLEPYGLNSHWNEAHHYAKWVEAGVQWIRVTLPWSEVEAVEGVFTWDDMDNAMDTAAELGLKVLAVIGYTPNWATSAAGNEKGAPTEDREGQMVEYARAVVARYDTRVAVWECWNEADYEPFFVNGPGTWARNNLANDEAGRRAQYLRTASQLLGAVGARAVTTSGWALASYPSVNNEFLEQIVDDDDDLSQTWFRQFPVFSYHCYGYPVYWRLTLMPRYYRETIESTYDGTSEHWITEHGITPGGDAASEDSIYLYLLRSYALALAQPRVTKMFWYSGGYAPDHACFLNGSSERQPAFYVHQILTGHWPGSTLVSVTQWGFSSAQGAIGTMLDGSRVAIAWNDGPGVMRFSELGLNVASGFNRYNDPIEDLDDYLDSNPVFLYLV